MKVTNHLAALLAGTMIYFSSFFGRLKLGEYYEKKFHLVFICCLLFLISLFLIGTTYYYRWSPMGTCNATLVNMSDTPIEIFPVRIIPAFFLGRTSCPPTMRKSPQLNMRMLVPSFFSILVNSSDKVRFSSSYFYFIKERRGIFLLHTNSLNSAIQYLGGGVQDVISENQENKISGERVAKIKMVPFCEPATYL